MNLLIVDDQTTVTSSLKEGLRGRIPGIDEIFTAASAEEARLIMMGFRVDILLTDIEMPEENGLSLFRWTMEKHPEVVGVFLTSHAEFDYAREAMRLGGFDYILQPARMEEIETMLRRAVKEARRRQKLVRLSEESIHIREQQETLLELLLIKTREKNQAECERLYNKLSGLFAAEIGHCVFRAFRIRVVRVETKNNAWDAELFKLVFRNILEELLAGVPAAVIVARENMGNYYAAAAVQDGLLPDDQWKKAMESFTAFINSHMDFKISVFPGQSVSRIYDAELPEGDADNVPGIYWGSDTAEKPEESDIAQRIRKAQEYIRENVGRGLTRTDVAQYLHINEDYFTRCFKKYTGFTFKDYDIMMRMETAKTLLEQTKLPVSMIAGRVGFDNFSHFSQAFRKYTGKTPSEYR